MDTPRVISHLLPPAKGIPNHPRWPVLVYPGAVAISGPDPAVAFEELFTRNRWPAAWRGGVYPFHHYHSNAHEVLGVYSGEVTIQVGGDEGIQLTAKPGDVVVLPAGTGHKALATRGKLGIVGAYPEGQDPDHCTPATSNAEKSVGNVAKVPMPECDPVTGEHGLLQDHWKT